MMELRTAVKLIKNKYINKYPVEEEQMIISTNESSLNEGFL